MKYVRKAAAQVHLALGFLLVAAVLLVGAAFARYQVITAGQEWTLQPKTAARSVFLLQEEAGGELSPLSGGWTLAGDERYILEFLLANGTGEKDFYPQDQAVHFQVIATLGIGDPSKVRITLQAHGMDYIAVPEKIEEGTSLYATYGSGWCYRFIVGSSEEAEFPLVGGRFAQHSMSLTVEGNGEYLSLLQLIASAG